MTLIPSLADSVLVCHCRAGQSCHADAIVKVFSEVAGRAGRVVYVGQSDSAGRFPRTDWTSPHPARSPRNPRGVPHQVHLL
eukprot:13469746-Heterocapsa_arctica.AAC.1